MKKVKYEIDILIEELGDLNGKLLELAEPLKKNQYGQYMIRRATEGAVKR